jgi:hypothetical protein
MAVKIGTLDIETAPLDADIWALFDQNIGINQLNREWSILAFCFKPLGKKPEYLDCRGQDDIRDDSKLLHRLWEILDEYDMVIAQNGKSFDLKKIRARMVMHGMPPYSPVRVLDTKIMAKREFGFTSNRLEWMSQYLTRTKKSIHNKYPGHTLWKACDADVPQAWEEMQAYNIRDVLATEELYLCLRPWYGAHHNTTVYSDGTAPACPHCGSEKVKEAGYSYLASGKFIRYQCGNCGAWSRSRKNLLPKEKRANYLVAI